MASFYIVFCLQLCYDYDSEREVDHMSKRNIRGKSGKQLYLNQLFLGGMKYTSSEMTEGVAKVISNYDISPTGDSAMPRVAFTSKLLDGGISRYIYPVKFNQAINEQHYIEFVNTVSEEAYINDTNISTDVSNAPLRFYSRGIGDAETTTKTIQGFTDSGSDGDMDDVTELLSHVNKFATKFSESDLASSLKQCYGENIEVYDGDTFTSFCDFGKVRIVGINCPEIRPPENWSMMAKKILETIVFTDINNRFFYVKDYGKDKYDRQLLDIYYSYGPDELVNLSEIMVGVGVAEPAYFYDDYPIRPYLLKAREYAKENKLGLHSGEIDPFLDLTKNKLEENSVDGKPYYSYNDYRYEFVRTEDTKAINQILTNKNNTVQFQYIDYLDSVATIGRIIDSSGTVVYKGVLYIKPIGIKAVNFVIECPPNNLEGADIDIIKSQETGYNLFNKNIINLDDSYDKHLVAGIKGLIVTDPTDKNIVLEATRGQEVNLHAVMNYGILNSLTKPAVGYRLHAQIIKQLDTGEFGGTIEGEYDMRYPITEQEITNQVFNFSKAGFSFSVYPSKSSDRLLSFRIKFTKLEVVLYNGDQEEVIDVTDQAELPSVAIDDVTLKDWFDDGRNYPISFGLGIDTFRIEILKETYSSISYTYPWKENPKSINVISYVDFEVTQVPTLDTFETKIFAKWEKAAFGSDLEKDEGWVTIAENESYEIKDNELVALQQSVEDTNWVVDELNNISLRYTIKFNQYLKILNKTYTDYPMNYKASDIYLAMPLFKISHTPKLLNQDDITNNINIKDATRIGVFNRQLYLYGPYTKSNFIQFSMFEEQWYLPFPYYNIEIPEPIVYVYPFLDSLVVFGKYNIYMLTGGVGVLDLTLHKIYENLSITAADVNLVNTVGTSLMFFNNNIGYLIVPNTYSDDPTNIKVYKLTDNISNALLNPEPLIKSLTGKIDFHTFSTNIFAEYITYVDNNVLNIATNYTVDSDKKVCIIYRYNQTYKYWNLYYSNIFEELLSPHIVEPHLGVQFITRYQNVNALTFLNSTNKTPYDIIHSGVSETSSSIETYLDTGYLSVDTMNDKRFKDIILELDNIKRDSQNDEMVMYCNFYIDGTPMLISEKNDIQVEDNDDTPSDVEPLILLKDKEFKTKLHHISSDDRDSNNDYIFDNTYGVAFKLKDSIYTNVGRTHVRIPVFGKGRLPSFSLRIVTKNNYEFINYSLIYKEKNINRRR